jgi:hypothetical protein
MAWIDDRDSLYLEHLPILTGLGERFEASTLGRNLTIYLRARDPMGHLDPIDLEPIAQKSAQIAAKRSAAGRQGGRPRRKQRKANQKQTESNCFLSNEKQMLSAPQTKEQTATYDEVCGETFSSPKKERKIEENTLQNPSFSPPEGESAERGPEPPGGGVLARANFTPDKLAQAHQLIESYQREVAPSWPAGDKAVLAACQALTGKHTLEQLQAAITNYAVHCRQTQRESRYRKSAAAFFGGSDGAYLFWIGRDHHAPGRRPVEHRLGRVYNPEVEYKASTIEEIEARVRANQAARNASGQGGAASA